MDAARKAGPKRFVILCLGRTGSTHLQSMLGFHSQARCLGELFGDGEQPTFAAAPEEDPAAFLDRVLEPAGERALGFKLPMNSIRLTPAAAELVRGDRELAAIRLSRRNRLAQLVSRQLLAATGISQTVFGDYGETKVRLDPAASIAALETIASEEAELDEIAAAHQTFSIAYEELGDEQPLVALQRWLGLDPEPLRSWYERLRTQPLAETISNWEEVVEALSDGPYAQFLSD